jgi:hypothetical protein
MTASPERALLAAVRTALLGDGDVASLLGPRLYDERPAEPVFPFLTLGRVETRPLAAAGVEALEHTLTLHVWSRYEGRAETLDALSAVRHALHDRPLTVSGRKLVFLYAIFADAFRAGDARTTHGVLRLRALTEPL